MTTLWIPATISYIAIADHDTSCPGVNSDSLQADKVLWHAPLEPAGFS